MKTMQDIFRVTSILILTLTAAVAADWPQYRGPNQDGISPEKFDVWPSTGPKLVWKVPNFSGWGSFAVSGDKVFTLVSRDINGLSSEVCISLDAATGKELWAADVTKGVKFPTVSDLHASEPGGYGPGSTPVVNEGKVYIYSYDMKLCCLEAQTGKELWRVDVLKDYDGTLPWYGSYSSPVVEGNEVIVAGGGPGQFVLAFNKNNGQVAWKTESAINQCSTPLVTTIHGVRQIVFYLKNDLMGISLKDHKTLWRSAVAQHNGHGGMQPVAFGDKVYVGSYTEGSALYQVIPEEGGFYSKRLWFNGSKDTGWVGSPVAKDGYLYAPTDWNSPSFSCIEIATGKVLWKQKDPAKGGPILVGDKLIFLTEKGGLILVEPKTEYKELGRFEKSIEGRCWSTAAFSNGRIYIRSNKEGACYDLSAK